MGIAGTFWLRGNARRSEIGLRMSLGASPRNILNEFLIESWFIMTIAWLIGIIFIFQHVYYAGFAETPKVPDSYEYIQNQFVPHFLIVSLIVYLLLLLITFIGTWIPARRAAKAKPADALRDE
ncbi:MAG: FtsX-like permease family protein [Bacteroides sp.]|nr:FtsX-like permease family protein [Bacteroides sp.]